MTMQCDFCKETFVPLRIKYERQSQEPNGMTYDAYVICPHCNNGFKLEDNIELELSDEQLRRLDDIYNATTDFCKVLTEDDNLEGNMEFVGEIVDCAVGVLVERLQRPIRYPGIVTTGEKDGVFEEYVEDIVEPVDKQKPLKTIFNAAGHRIHK